MNFHHCENVLKILRTQGVGYKYFWQLLQERDTVTNILTFLRKREFTIPSDQEISKIITMHQKKGIQMLCYCNSEYPALLKEIEGYPPILFYKGNLSLLKKRSIAIVGARNASLSGLKVAQKMAYDLSQYYDCSVFSGFARGIDTAAHQGSLEAGTVAVLAQGIDVIYPPENKKLYENIQESGLLLSHLTYDVKPTIYSFPVRNKILAGLVQSVAIVEAAYNSGTMITAQSALDFNKDLFVVPGSPLDPRYKGSHKLIKEGAILVEGVYDILEYLGIESQKVYEPCISKEKKNINSLKNNILNFLSYDGQSLDDLVLCFGRVKISAINSALSELEIENTIIRDKKGLIYKK